MLFPILGRSDVHHAAKTPAQVSMIVQAGGVGDGGNGLLGVGEQSTGRFDPDAHKTKS